MTNESPNKSNTNFSKNINTFIQDNFFCDNGEVHFSQYKDPSESEEDKEKNNNDIFFIEFETTMPSYLNNILTPLMTIVITIQRKKME
jgi:hypothetical protein